MHGGTCARLQSDGTLFRYLIDRAGCAKGDILHAGQSQFTDLVGGKPLGLTIAWINRRHVALDGDVPRPDYVFPDIGSLGEFLGPYERAVATRDS